MEKEYLLTVVEQSAGLELESSLLVTWSPERLNQAYKGQLQLGHTVRVYERSVTDWKKTELEKISSPE